MKLRLTKISAVPSPEVPTASWAEYRLGESNPKSLPSGYWVEGELLDPIRVGAPVLIRREVRNGVRIDGVYSSSPVVSWDGKTLVTRNSSYRVEPLPEAPPASS